MCIFVLFVVFVLVWVLRKRNTTTVSRDINKEETKHLPDQNS